MLLRRFASQRLRLLLTGHLKDPLRIWLLTSYRPRPLLRTRPDLCVPSPCGLCMMDTSKQTGVYSDEIVQLEIRLQRIYEAIEVAGARIAEQLREIDLTLQALADV